MKSGLAAGLAQQMDDEVRQFMFFMVQPVAREAMTAFLQKRRPDFIGMECGRGGIVAERRRFYVAAHFWQQIRSFLVQQK
jgi:hypothetical protein